MNNSGKEKILARLQRIMDLIPLMGENDPLFPGVLEEIEATARKLESWALDQF